MSTELLRTTHGPAKLHGVLHRLAALDALLRWRLLGAHLPQVILPRLQGALHVAASWKLQILCSILARTLEPANSAGNGGPGTPQITSKGPRRSMVFEVGGGEPVGPPQGVKGKSLISNKN